jgi:hypothetical protein
VRRCVALPVVLPGTWLAPPESNYIKILTFTIQDVKECVSGGPEGFL